MELIGYLFISLIAIGILTFIICVISCFIGFMITNNKDNDVEIYANVAFILALYGAVVTYFLIII